MEYTHFHPVNTENKKGWKKVLSFLGPAYLVSVGYMDPGNWATDIAAGSKYGYTLLWVIIASNLAAILVQNHSARLGIVTGKDLAQFSRSYYPQKLNFVFWVFAEIAIAATDLAEILGMAIGLKLLFGLDLLYGVVLSLFDTLIIMFLIKKGMRVMEAIILALIAIIGLSFTIELFYSKPDVSELIKGIFPSIPDSNALYIAIGIIGATVMPHNLYLHSSLVQSRRFPKTDDGKRKTIRFNFIDTTIALNLALFVNGAILILAASAFYKSGHYEIEDIMDAHKMLAPILGTVLAPILFAVALIASGQSSTLTGTLTGQIIMEGYLNIRIAPWLRRLITRLLAVIPAFFVILIFGESEAGPLLILSQVILSLQLGFAVIPLLHWVSSKEIMGKFQIKALTKVVSWVVVLGILGLNIKLVFDFMLEWLNSTTIHWFYVSLILTPIFAALILLIYVIIEPFFSKKLVREILTPHTKLTDVVFEKSKPYQKIGICLDFSPSDQNAINRALKFGTKKTEFVLIHVVESGAARALRKDAYDFEVQNDDKILDNYVEKLRAMGINTSKKIGFGYVGESVPKICNELDLELLVLASHNKGILHRIFKGTTIGKVQRKLRIPLYIVKNK